MSTSTSPSNTIMCGWPAWIAIFAFIWVIGMGATGFFIHKKREGKFLRTCSGAVGIFGIILGIATAALLGATGCPASSTSNSSQGTGLYAATVAFIWIAAIAKLAIAWCAHTGKIGAEADGASAPPPA